MRVDMDSELDQLGERIAEQAAHLDAAMHRLLADLREFDQRGGWHVQGAMSCAHWLAWRVSWDLGTARDRVRVARKLAEFSAIDDALRRGEISYSKVRAMVRVATPANEQLLLEHARLMTAAHLEKLCRKYALVQRHGQDVRPGDDVQRRYVRRRDTEDGMVKIEAVLHAEEAELVWTMLNHAAAQLARQPGATAWDDSEESNVAPSAAPSSVPSCPVSAEVCTTDDSAETREVVLESTDPTAPTDPIETSQPTGAARSLLDQLLDEADVQREAEGGPSARNEDSASEPTPERGESVLRQAGRCCQARFRSRGCAGIAGAGLLTR